MLLSLEQENLLAHLNDMRGENCDTFGRARQVMRRPARVVEATQTA
jgi:hypothetical protein